MGEEVKVTVIASGFRGQKPERRASMLTVEEAPVISTPQSPAPVTQISLVARDDGYHEPVAAPVLAPKPPRFLSQEEEEAVTVEPDKKDKVEEEETVKAEEPDPWSESGFFSTPAPSEPPANSAAVAEPLMETAATHEPEMMEPSAAPAPPRFAELAEEPVFTPLPREYVPAFTGRMRGPAAPDENQTQPGSMLFPETDEETQPDLERPTFLRNLRL